MISFPLLLSLLSVASSVLYSLAGWTNKLPSTQLASVSLDANLTWSLIGSPHTYFDGAEKSAVDAKREIFYSLTYVQVSPFNYTTYLTGLKLDTGEEVYHFRLPIPQASFEGDGQRLDIDPDSGDLFVAAMPAESGGKNPIYRVVPSTGDTKLIARLPVSLENFGGDSTYDWRSNVLYLLYGHQIFGFDVKALNFTFDTMIQHNLHSIAYDNTKSQVVGTGTVPQGEKNEPPYDRCIMTVDSKGILTVGPKIEGYGLIVPSMGPVDWERRVMYSAMQPTDAKMVDPAYLLEIDVGTGKVISKSLCYINSKTNKPPCPWTIEIVQKA